VMSVMAGFIVYSPLEVSLLMITRYKFLHYVLEEAMFIVCSAVTS
jgi:hypothetical protein